MQIYPSEQAMARLERAARDLDRPVADLATAAVEEAALAWARERGFPGERDDAAMGRDFMAHASPAWML